MNEQQLQQILTIQQAIAAAATAAVINSLLNPQQAAAGLNNPTTANALTEALQNSQNQLDLQHQHQHQQQQQQPDSRQDSPIATSSSPAANNIPLNDLNRLQELMLQLQQQAAISGGTGLSAAAQQQQQHQQQQQQQQQPVQAALAAALNLNLNNTNNTNLSLQQQLHNHLAGGSPLSQSPIGNRLQLSQTELIQQLVTSAATGSNSISNQSSPNKKLKSRHIQQPLVPPFTPHTRASSDATNKPQQHQSTPKSHHSNLANLGTNRNNSSNNNNNSSSSSSFLPNNVGLPRKLVRGQDVWLGRGAEQTRQILKCMWCGQSFRTLAEMTQHMRETQHYTNIISQEQITSWRQPDGSETGSSKQHSSKQSSHNTRLLNDHLDDSSDRLNDSEDSFSNEDEPSPKQRSIKSKPLNKSPNIKHESATTDNNESMIAIHNFKTAKPITRSRKRDNEDTSKTVSKREKLENEQPQTNTNPSHQRVLSDLNKDSEANKESKIDSDDQENSSNNQISTRASDTDEERAESTTPSTKSENVKQEGNQDSEQREKDLSERSPTEDFEEEHQNDAADDISQNDTKESKNILDDDEDEDGDENVEKDIRDSDHADNDSYNGDSKNSKPSSKKPQIDITSTSSAKPVMLEGQKVDASGDPLSELETMVEKSFDPRLRPGVASGGILQRLGIDEEVCPPWQHINYANWYAAAAYGHPMAAALLAAGINLQNGIKLGKNLSSKKSDDD